MKLDIRLRMVAGLVRPGMSIVDVGTDHAYVPTYLILNGIIPSAIASDIKVGPLNNAKKTIAQNDLADKITPILSDGLKDIPQDNTDFVIAGMGGELIAKILNDSKWVEVPGNHFVLQPQTHPEDLREYLWTNGYEIIKEDVVKDKTHLYLAIEASYTGLVEEHTKADYFVGKLLDSTSSYKTAYLEHLVKRLQIQHAANHRKEVKDLIDEITSRI